MKRFNIRVYGLLINEQDQVLVSDEHEKGFSFTKFPGGGLEHGEGTIECLKREFAEECAGMKIEVISHFYTTDFFQKSAFDESQLISIYYQVASTDPFQLPVRTKQYDFDELKEGAQQFRWIAATELSHEHFSFPIDKKVAALLAERYK